MGKILIIKGATYTPPSSSTSGSTNTDNDDVSNNTNTGSGSTNTGSTNTGSGNENTGGSSSALPNGNPILQNGCYIYYLDYTTAIYYANRADCPNIGAVVIVVEDLTDTPYTSVTVDASVSANWVALIELNWKNGGCDTTDPNDVFPGINSDCNSPTTFTKGAGETKTIDTSRGACMLYICDTYLGQAGISDTKVDKYVEYAATKVTFS